jgi:biopolymer transport protein ExbD
MTPLVDIVMVILIFLMLAGSFGTAEHYLISDVPIQAKGAGGKPPQGSVIPTKFTISVAQEGAFYLLKAGNFASIRNENPVNAGKELNAQLARQFDNFKSAGVKTDDVQIIIYPEQNVPLDGLVPAFEAAQEAGFTKVGFGVKQK